MTALTVAFPSGLERTQRSYRPDADWQATFAFWAMSITCFRFSLRAVNSTTVTAVSWFGRLLEECFIMSPNS